MSTTLDTLQLDGWQLDYFTGLALGRVQIDGDTFNPSGTYADLGEVLLEMRTLMWGADASADWHARADGCSQFARGNSPAVAMCRALVFAKLGKSVVLPDCAQPVCVDSYENDSNAPSGCEDLFA